MKSDNKVYLTDKDILEDGTMMIPGLEYIVMITSYQEVAGPITAIDLIYVKRTTHGFLFKTCPGRYRMFKAEKILGLSPRRATWFRKFLDLLAPDI